MTYQPVRIARLAAMLIIAADSFVEMVNAEGYGGAIGAKKLLVGVEMPNIPNMPW